MLKLHRAFFKAVRDNTKPVRLLSLVIARKLREQGAKESDIEDSARRVAEHILRDPNNKDFTLGDNANEGSPISISLEDSDLETLAKDLDGAITETVPKVARQIGDLLYKTIKRSAANGLQAQRAERDYFRARLLHYWEKAFDALALELALAAEVGDEVNTWLRSRRRTKNPHIVEAMTRLHARACQTADEVLCLIESGFADGALARWRTLHEIAVVSAVLYANGERLAERYLLHEDIDSLRTANLYNRFAAASGAKPIPARDMKFLEDRAARKVHRFGDSFKHQYGWAAEALEKDRPTFADLEAAAGLANVRPQYKLASDVVHAGPKGMMLKLGLLAGSDAVLLAGPSNAGLDEAGKLTASSLANITIDLLMVRPTLDSTVRIHVMGAFARDAQRLFAMAQRKLERDAKKR